MNGFKLVPPRHECEEEEICADAGVARLITEKATALAHERGYLVHDIAVTSAFGLSIFRSKIRSMQDEDFKSGEML